MGFSNWEFALRIVLSSVCGCIIGLERSDRQKGAGIRTHSIVALGSALMMIVSKYAFFDVVIFESISLDASRIAANIITGISFVGAGIIFARGYTITGLTTASGIWATAGVGMALGGGMYEIGLFSTGLIVLVQMMMHGFLAKLERTTSHEIGVVLYDNKGAIERLRKQLEAEGIVFNSSHIDRIEDRTVMIQFTIRDVPQDKVEQVLAKLTDNEEIKSIVR